MWNSLHPDKYFREGKVRIISNAGLYDPFGLIEKCIYKWNDLLIKHELIQDKNSNHKPPDSQVNQSNTQTVYGSRVSNKSR